jgi:hypothetical protein
MLPSMPPDALPPDDARGKTPEDANVVDPAVLAERRAQRAEGAERRAADAQARADRLAQELADLEADRDAARAEAAAAREGADVVKAEARHLQAERDDLRAHLARAHAERDAARAEAEAERAAAAEARPVAETGAASVAPSAGESEPAPAAAERRPPAAAGSSAATAGIAHDARAAGAPTGRGAAEHGAGPAGSETRAQAGGPAPTEAGAAPSQPPGPQRRPVALSAALARERRLVAQRAGQGLRALPPAQAERATPVTALALERERSSRLQARLDESAAVEADLRAQLATLQEAIAERREAERRIEAALARVRTEFDQGRRPGPAGGAGQRAAPLGAPPAERAAPAAGAPAPPSQPEPSGTLAAAPAEPPTAGPAGAPPAGAFAPAADAAPSTAPAQPSPSGPVAAPHAQAPVGGPATAPEPAIDAERLEAARSRLQATAPEEEAATQPAGAPAPWLPQALRELAQTDPALAGRVLAGLLPAHGLVAQRPLKADIALAGRGCLLLDAAPGSATVNHRRDPRSRRETDLRIATDDAGLARLLLGRRRTLQRAARVRGRRRHLRELRRLASTPLALRDLAQAGVRLDPQLTFALVAHLIDPAVTAQDRFTIAHAPPAGGPAGAWLQIDQGNPATALTAPPAATPKATIRSTRGGLLALLAGIEPQPGDTAAVDGDPLTVTLIQQWIAAAELPRA